MKSKIIAFIILLLFMACGDEYYGPTGGDGNNPEANFIETEVSLSPDREYIYFIVRDTIFDLYSGINRARISQPVRERIRGGNNYHSPTVDFENDIVAYLYDNRVHYYSISNDSMWNSGLADTLESIVFVNDSLLLGCRNDSIFMVNEVDSVLEFLRTGWDPTFVAADTFICVVSLDNYTYHFIKDYIEVGLHAAKYSISEDSPETLFTLQTEAFPRWPTLDPSSDHIAYGIEFFEQKFIYSGIAGQSPAPGEELNFIDSSEYSKPYILSPNLIVFSGPPGYLYQSDFEGTKSFPFIYSGE